jgi:hypothetical protein
MSYLLLTFVVGLILAFEGLEELCQAEKAGKPLAFSIVQILIGLFVSVVAVLSTGTV